MQRLVGRDTELDELVRAVATGGVFLLAGEAGIGKSRLSEELATRAKDTATIVWGRCWEGGGAPAFWPWIQIVRSLSRGHTELGELGRLLPELARGNAVADRFELFDALAALVTGATHPLVVIFEDLHAADRASLEALAFVVRQLRGVPVTVIGTYRDHEVRQQPAIAEVLARVARAGRVIDLRRLTIDEVAAIVGDRAAAVHEATAGNPLFVCELARVLASRGHDGALPIPDGVRATIREHLRLAPAARDLLDAACVLGRDFSLAALAAAVGRDGAAVVSLLDRAVDVALLSQPSPGLYRFGHTLIRDTLYDDLGAARRAAGHRAAALALEGLHAGDPAAPLDEIAHHWLEAGPAETARAITAARRAADRAVRQLAHEEACAVLTRALEALERFAPGDASTRAELLVERGRARLLHGDSAGKDDCLAAAELARGLASTELLARAALTYGTSYFFAKIDRSLVAMLEEALARLPDGDSSLRARVLARLSAAHQPAVDPSGPIEMAREAIAIARRLGDDDTLFEVLFAAGSTMQNLAPPDERLVIANELLALAHARNDPATAAWAHRRIVQDRVELADLDGVERAVEDFAAAVAPLRHPRYHAAVPVFRTFRAIAEGRFAEVDALLSEAEPIVAASGDLNSKRWLVATRASRARMRGEPIPDDHVDYVGYYNIEPVFHVRLEPGQEDAVRAALARVPDEVFDRFCLFALHAVRMAEVATFLGDRALAERIYARAVPHASRFGHWSGGPDSPVSRALYLFAAMLDRWDEAVAHHDAAIALARRQGMRPLVARIQIEWAELLRKRGLPADAPLAEARAIVDALDLPALRVRIESFGAAPAPRPITTTTITLSREGDMWRVEGEGESVHVKHARGLELLAELVAHPGREIHVLELSGADEADRGDAGEALDTKALAAYRTRLRELDSELDEAQTWNDTARASRLRAERDALTGELARAVGLGGRARREGSAVERARTNVQRRLSLAIRKIGEHGPALAHRLGETVATGTFCAFLPDAPRRQRAKASAK